VPAYRSSSVLDDGFTLHPIGRGSEIEARHPVVKRIDNEVEGIVPASLKIPSQGIDYVIFPQVRITHRPHIDGFVIVACPDVCVEFGIGGVVRVTLPEIAGYLGSQPRRLIKHSVQFDD